MTRLYPSIAAAAALPGRRPLHLAVGMFDGVHIGHRAVLDAAVLNARRTGGVGAVLTFSPHPSHLFRPQDPVRLIMEDSAKVDALSALGMDAVIVQPFDPAFAAIEAEELIPHLRASLPGLNAIYVGENWRFGRGRRGDIHLLVAEAKRHGVHVVSAPRINHDGEPISSTRIRAALTDGRIEEVNTLLGRAYCSAGVVTPGKQLGRTIGFPTLNLPWGATLSPRLGVYVARVSKAEGSEALPAVMNFGLRPTVEQTTAPQLEIHLLGEDCPFGPGDRLRVEWLHFLRPETRFAGVDELRAAIAADRDAAQAWLGLPG
ncbi:MAG: riboflavin biosynthesis protein RibF [Verrucomicrobiota bacterium]